MVSGKARAIAVLVQIAPVLLGVPLYLAAFSLAGMLVFFFPGVFMVIAGLLAAAIARLFAPPGFVRTHAAGSLRFHGIVAIIVVPVIVLVFVIIWGGYMGAASSGATLLGVILPLVEIVRSVMYGVTAARGSHAAPVPNP